MSRRREVQRVKDELAYSAHAWAGDISSNHNLGVRVVLTAAALPGSWDVRAEACEVVDKRAKAVVVQVRKRVDSEQGARTLAETVFDALVELSRELDRSTPIERAARP